MTQQTIADPASIQRQALLLAAFEAIAAEWQDKADRYRQIGAPSCRIETALTIAYAAKRAAELIRERLTALTIAYAAKRAAELIRERLEALSGLTEGDVAVSGPVTVTQAPVMTPAPQSVALAEACQPDEPPEQLAALSDWLRARLGPVFVWVTASRWQEIAWLLLASRPGGVR